MTEPEVWKEIPYAPGYEISSLRRLRSFWAGKPHKRVTTPTLLALDTKQATYRLRSEGKQIKRAPEVLFRDAFGTVEDASTLYPDEEIWKAVPYAPGYEFSTHERLRSYRRPGIGGSLATSPTIINLGHGEKPRYVLRVDINKVDKTPGTLLLEVFGLFRCGTGRRGSKYGCKRLFTLEHKCEDRKLCLSCGKEKKRNEGIAWRYNLTSEQYSNLLQLQNGVCAGCQWPPLEDGSPLEVDHDHETNKVRGLLCGACNKATGLLGDDPSRLRRIAAYLEHPTVG